MDLPPRVERLVEEIAENSPDYTESQVWATAWSIYCKYVEPGSTHCSRGPDGYLTKKASLSHLRRLAHQHPTARKYLVPFLRTGAALADRVEGTEWRHEPRKKRKASVTFTYEGPRKGPIDFDGRNYLSEASDLRLRKLPGTVSIQNRVTGDTDLFSNPRPTKDREGDIVKWTYKGTGGMSLVIFND